MVHGSIVDGKVLKRADPSTIQDKFLVGYQGWFTCAGDGEPVGPGHHGWLHWFNYPIPDGGRPNTDLWPDVSDYSPSELFPAPGLKFKSGEQAFLFSSRHPKTVQRHFNWMAQHGVDGAFLQRFAGQCDLEGGNEGIMRIRDEVGDRVREAAEKEGRVFAIMYDVSGVAADRIQQIIERDWLHLVCDKGVLDSPNYLKEKGKPVIALWGFGFDNSNHTPALIKSIVSFIRKVTPGGAYIMAGTPAHWRTATSDADRDPLFLDVWLHEFDAISPWTVGRYRTEEDTDGFYERVAKGDADLLRKRAEEGHKKVDYVPVVLPGGSGFNLSEGKWGFNDIKRNGGRFLWNQVFNARRLGVRVMYGAMWDEYDEGTAFMPVVEKKRLLPESDKYPFMALDEDGFDLPSDWYMRICGFAAEGLRSERQIHDSFPSKELQDYWSTRPKYEPDVEPRSGASASGSGSGNQEEDKEDSNRAYQEWLKTQKEDKDEPPPPPYSLEADEIAQQENASASTLTRTTGADDRSSVLPTVSVQDERPMASASSSSSPVPSPSSSYHRPPHSPNAVSTSSLHSQQSEGRPGSSRPHSPMAALTNDFARHGIQPPLPTSPKPGDIVTFSYSPQSGAALSPSSSTTSFSPSPLVHQARPTTQDRPQSLPIHGRPSPSSISPPPLHPAHPAAVHAVPRPNFQNRPASQPPSHHRPQTTAGYQAPQSTVGSSIPEMQQGSSSQQWPPTEWNVNRPQVTEVPYQPYQQNTHQARPPPPTGPPPDQSWSSFPSPSGGANLSRPQTFSASTNASSGPYLRPHTAVGRPSSRPTTPNAYPQPHSPGDAQFPSVPFPGAGVPTPGGGPYSGASSYATSPPGGPSFPSGPNTSPYSPGSPSFPSRPEGSHYQPGGSFSSGRPSSYTPSEPHYPPQMSTYPGNSYSHHPSPPHSPPASSYESRPQYPVAPGGSGGYPGASQQYPPPPPQPAYNYPGQYDSAPFLRPTSTPMPNPNANSGPWFPGSQNPSLPPRPPTQTPYQSYQASTYAAPNGSSSHSSSAGPLGFAMSAVDRYAGQLEGRVGSIAQAGTKLFGKFTK